MDWVFDFVAPDEFPEIAAATGAMLNGRRTYEVGNRMEADKPGSARIDLEPLAARGRAPSPPSGSASASSPGVRFPAALTSTSGWHCIPGSPSPQPSDNPDQVPASILEPEVPAGRRQDQPPSSGETQSPRHHGQLPAWRLAGVQDEEQEAQVAPPVCDVVREQLAGGIRRDGWLADDRYPEAGRGEGVGHRMQRPGPETQQRGLAAHGPLSDVVVGREIIWLEAGLAVPQVLCEGMVNGHDEPSAGLEHAPQLG